MKLLSPQLQLPRVGKNTRNGVVYIQWHEMLTWNTWSTVSLQSKQVRRFQNPPDVSGSQWWIKPKRDALTWCTCTDHTDDKLAAVSAFRSYSIVDKSVQRERFCIIASSVHCSIRNDWGTSRTVVNLQVDSTWAQRAHCNEKTSPAE